jgi:threonylcarbamoyladenosine tRNA methylthiotransferase CDKAL1
MRIYIHTQGCSANRSDSEVMAGILQEKGHTFVERWEDADLIVLNTCTVKSPTEMKAYSLLKKWKGKQVVVAGCIPQSDAEKLKIYPLVGTRQVHRIAEVVAAAGQAKILHLLDLEKTQRLLLPHVRVNPVIEIVPINAGCLGSCAFCKTKQARGALYSYAQHDIVKQIELAVQAGVKEIWLTSQDTGAYGRDLGTSLPNLLRAVLKIEGEFMVRVGMMNPDQVVLFLDELLPLFSHPKLFKFLHVPLQSGSDAVLQAMQRRYTAKVFEQIVKTARNVVPEITIATDVIAGFPGETADDFYQTKKLLETLVIPVVNISKFYPRPGTRAARMKKLPTKTVKQRSTILAQQQKQIITNNEWLGWQGRILIDEQTKNGVFGRTSSYRPVIVHADIPLGSWVPVEITKTTWIDLRGHVLSR